MFCEKYCEKYGEKYVLWEIQWEIWKITQPPLITPDTAGSVGDLIFIDKYLIFDILQADETSLIMNIIISSSSENQIRNQSQI